MIKTERGEKIMVCDICETEFPSGTLEFSQFINAAKQDGWLIRPEAKEGAANGRIVARTAHTRIWTRRCWSGLPGMPPQLAFAPSNPGLFGRNAGPMWLQSDWRLCLSERCRRSWSIL
jgi:hypothetical protein